jgi:hypothetical protein
MKTGAFRGPDGKRFLTSGMIHNEKNVRKPAAGIAISEKNIVGGFD